MTNEEIESIRQRNEDRRKAWGTKVTDSADSNYNVLFIGHAAVHDVDTLLNEIERLRDGVVSINVIGRTEGHDHSLCHDIAAHLCPKSD